MTGKGKTGIALRLVAQKGLHDRETAAIKKKKKKMYVCMYVCMYLYVCMYDVCV